MMNVMLVSHRFPPDQIGGVERYTQALAADLVGLGHRVSVVTRRSESGRKELSISRERLDNGVPVYRFIAGPLRYERTADHDENISRMFSMAMLETAPDVVHFNHLLGFSPHFIQLAERLGAAVVVSLHDFYFACPRVHLQKPGGDLCEGPDHGRECAATCFANGAKTNSALWGMRTLYFRNALRKAHEIIAYSRYVADYFEESTTAPPIHVIPNGVPNRFPALRRAERTCRNAQLTIAYCGTVLPHKGPHVILDAIRASKLQPVQLIIAGNLPEPEYARRLRAAAAGIPGLKLNMFGNYRRSQLPVLLEDVDCVVVPSLVPEAGPILPREALALGVPVLVARLGALPELVEEGRNGFSFEPGQPGELASILRRLARESRLLNRLRDGARETQVMTLNDHAARVAAVYQSAQERRRHTLQSRDWSELDFLRGAMKTLSEPTKRL